MSLRARLLIALLGVGLVPSIIIALLAVFQLNLAMAPWFRPGIDRALESALQITQTSIARFESTVLSRSADWAQRWPLGGLTDEQRNHWARELKATSLDFVQTYALADTGWVLDQQVLPEGTLLAETLDLSAEIDSALAGSPLLRSQRGALAAVANLQDGGVLVAGLRVNPDFFGEIRAVADGVTFYGRSTIYGPLERMSHWFIVAAVILLVGGLAAVIANAIARETSRPLRELAAATDRVAASDFSVRVEPSGARELKRLGGSFNTMIIRLREAQAAIRESERESAWRDAARKLAHEFKGILSPLKLALQRFEARVAALPSEQRETTARSLGRALSGVEALERLSSQFHQYARMPEPNFEQLDVAEIVRSAADQAPNARVTHSEPSLIEADRILLSRGVHNLIVNAVEASPPGTAVDVTVRTEGPNTVIEVLDRGSGLPPDLLPRLFDPYVSNKKRGSGLGLALVRDIARLHDGTITLENREGGGARARLTLPRKERQGRSGAGHPRAAQDTSGG